MNNRSIGFSLKEGDIPLGAFIRAAQQFSELLRALDVSISGARNLDWCIADLGVGSAKLTVRPALRKGEGRDCGDEIISSALLGLKLIERKAKRPSHFTYEALKKAKGLVGVINGKVESIVVFGGGETTEIQRVRVTQQAAAHVDQLMGTSSVASGSIEGTLEAASIHRRPEFAVYDVITARRIRCLCDRETLQQVLAHVGRRLSVTGEVRFNARGEPTSLQVSSFRPVGGRELPQPEDIRGLFSEARVDIDEWAEYVRDG